VLGDGVGNGDVTPTVMFFSRFPFTTKLYSL
jgi:hypothetical protein